MRAFAILLILVVLLGACVAPIPEAPSAGTVSEQVDDDHAHVHDDYGTELPEEMGEVNFAVSCTPDAQAEFNRGMAFLHSFWFPPAIDSFSHVAEMDAGCAMAYWGVAMGLLDIPWSPTPEQALADGWAAVEQANAVGVPTQREQAYIDAVATLYRDADTTEFGARTGAYVAAMEHLVQEYPDDTEAKIFYALALLMTASREDKTYANQRQAAEILEPILAEQPNHPGVAHYLVHSYDYPALAEKGLNAAQRFAEIAPAAPHALHMPAHIFTRLGYWEESIATNRASAAADEAGLPADASTEDALHAMDYMMYGHLQLAQDEAAQQLMDKVLNIRKVDPAGFGAAYALAAMPARYALERGQWADAAQLTLPPADFLWDRFPHAEAQLVFAKGLGAARAGDVETARQELARLQELREAIIATNQGYWAGQADIQMEAISAWIALAEDRPDEALATMQAAVELESATDKHPVTPGPIMPARELLGEMLLELDQPAEALAAFEASQEVEPNRFRGLYGAARAAELAGEMDKAQSFYSALANQADAAESDRAELTMASAFLNQ